jgi:HAE1 family hydrophobic/amphiphilic exporter-1
MLDRFNQFFEWLADIYQGAIAWALDHRKSMVFLAFLIFVAGIMVFGMLESNFMAGTDQGEFQLNFKTSPDASFAETKDRLELVLAAIKEVPEVAQTYATIGAREMDTVRDAGVYIKLIDRKLRKKQDDVLRDVRERLARISGITISIIEAGRLDDRKALLVSIRGEEISKLKEYGAQLKSELYKVKGIVDLEMTMEQDIPEFRLSVDRERLVDTGLMTVDIVRALAMMVGGQVVTTYEDEDGDAVNVRLRLPASLRSDPNQVEQLRLSVIGKNGRPVLIPIAHVAHYQMSTTPAEINRQDLNRELMISANLDGLALGTAGMKVKEAAARIDLAPGYRVILSGESEEMAESFAYMAESLLLAIIFVYLILAAQFESFIDPLAIMLSLPLSIVGMAGMLYLTGDTVNIMSLIGLIMLMGLVTKNAILLIDYSKILQERGIERRASLITAGRTRLRPIMMTTLAMIFGMLPLALALGAGAEMRAPMARAVVGGLITSTFLTLLVVPVVYTILDDFAAWLRRKWTGTAEVHP